MLGTIAYEIWSFGAMALCLVGTHYQILTIAYQSQGKSEPYARKAVRFSTPGFALLLSKLAYDSYCSGAMLHAIGFAIVAVVLGWEAFRVLRSPTVADPG